MIHESNLFGILLRVFIHTFYVFVLQKAVRNMGKLSDDGKWLQENLNELLQDSPETDKQREQKRLAELLSKFSELQPNLNKVTDKSAMFSKAYDYRDTMEKHNGWLDETQRLVNDDPSIDGLEDARAYLQEHEVRHPSFSEILFNLYKMFRGSSLQKPE